MRTDLSDLVAAANPDNLDLLLGELEIPKRPKRRCSMVGCDLPHKARGLCVMHYRRWKRYGSRHRLSDRRLANPPGVEEITAEMQTALVEYRKFAASLGIDEDRQIGPAEGVAGPSRVNQTRERFRK